ncbi:hypothetical protein RR46_08790 [Papilio xuthus]|uniref:Uncharacterized protein n=1 Tax=Papilio xuthus TaxID=66420 RepID=A0A194PPG2_PAPXU|nr:hypothetical protein RR46_08790 [Papilio xuthus]
MMAVKYEARPASVEPEACRAPAADRRALSADSEPRTLAARKAYPEPCGEAVDTDAEAEAPLDLSTHARKEISVREFARHSFADPADYVRAQVILRQSRGYLAAAAAAARDSGTESDDSAERLSPGDDAMTGKAYKKSLMKRYSPTKRFLLLRKVVVKVPSAPAFVYLGSYGEDSKEVDPNLVLIDCLSRRPSPHHYIHTVRATCE